VVAGFAVGGVAAAHAAGKPQPPSVVVMQPGYATLAAVEISVRLNGVHLHGRQQPVRAVSCNGVGAAGPSRKIGGFVQSTYHLFLCRVTTPNVRDIAMTVKWWANDTYRYDFPGLK
jgi:hypothetical protein